MPDSPETLAKVKELEEANDALTKALLPFALIAEKNDLKAAMLAASDGETFELQPWFERLCERARFVLHAKAPDVIRSVNDGTKH